MNTPRIFFCSLPAPTLYYIMSVPTFYCLRSECTFYCILSVSVFCCQYMNCTVFSVPAFYSFLSFPRFYSCCDLSYQHFSPFCLPTFSYSHIHYVPCMYKSNITHTSYMAPGCCKLYLVHCPSNSEASSIHSFIHSLCVHQIHTRLSTYWI